MVKYLGVDPKNVKKKVSRKALLPRPPREEKTYREKKINLKVNLVIVNS